MLLWLWCRRMRASSWVEKIRSCNLEKHSKFKIHASSRILGETRKILKYLRYSRNIISLRRGKGKRKKKILIDLFFTSCAQLTSLFSLLLRCKWNEIVLGKVKVFANRHCRGIIQLGLRCLLITLAAPDSQNGKKKNWMENQFNCDMSFVCEWTWKELNEKDFSRPTPCWCESVRHSLQSYMRSLSESDSGVTQGPKVAKFSSKRTRNYDGQLEMRYTEFLERSSYITLE
jgi:hypothetical protein